MEILQKTVKKKIMEESLTPKNNNKRKLKIQKCHQDKIEEYVNLRAKKVGNFGSVTDSKEKR